MKSEAELSVLREKLNSLMDLDPPEEALRTLGVMIATLDYVLDSKDNPVSEMVELIFVTVNQRVKTKSH